MSCQRPSGAPDGRWAYAWRRVILLPAQKFKVIHAFEQDLPGIAFLDGNIPCIRVQATLRSAAPDHWRTWHFLINMIDDSPEALLAGRQLDLRILGLGGDSGSAPSIHVAMQILGRNVRGGRGEQGPIYPEEAPEALAADWMSFANGGRWI